MGLFTDDADVEAINVYIHGQKPKNEGAKAAFNNWVKWYEANKNDLYYSQDDLDHATNLRNAFNRAQAVTAAEKAVVENTIQDGFSLEQAAGKTDRRDASGNVPEAPPSPISPKTEALLIGFAALATITAVVVLVRKL